MSTRDFVKTQIDLLPEEALETVIKFIGMYNEEINRPIVISDEVAKTIDAKLQEGMESIEAGRVHSSSEIETHLQGLYRKYDV